MTPSGRTRLRVLLPCEGDSTRQEDRVGLDTGIACSSHARVITCALSCDEAQPSRANRAPFWIRRGIAGYVNLPLTVPFAHPTPKKTRSCSSLLGHTLVCSTMLEQGTFFSRAPPQLACFSARLTLNFYYPTSFSHNIRQSKVCWGTTLWQSSSNVFY